MFISFLSVSLFDILCHIITQRNNDRALTVHHQISMHANWVIQITRFTKGKALERDRTGLMSKVTEGGTHCPSVVLQCGASEQSQIFIKTTQHWQQETLFYFQPIPRLSSSN